MAKAWAWFQQGCDAFKWAFPEIAARIPAQSFYVCPICLRAFGEDALTAGLLTREHVPPQSLGGRRLVLTCEPCNSGAGHAADVHARLEADAIGFVRGDVREIKAHLRTESGRMPVRISAGGGGVLVKGVKRASSDETRRAVESDFFAGSQGDNWKDFKCNVELSGFSKRAAEASWLRSAYLIYFAALGPRWTPKSRN